MVSEAKIIISFLFKRSGKDKLKESEIYLPLSLDLGWLSASQAKNFVEYAIQQEFLIKKNGFLIPNFDIEKITTPLGFLPKEKSFKIEKAHKKTEGEQNVIDVIIQRIAEKSDVDFKDIYNEIKQVGTEKKVIEEVAGLFIANKYRVDVKDFYRTVEVKITKENEE